MRKIFGFLIGFGLCSFSNAYAQETTPLVNNVTEAAVSSNISPSGTQKAEQTATNQVNIEELKTNIQLPGKTKTVPSLKQIH